MSRPTRVLIDGERLRRNLRLLKQWTGGEFFCPMVKANAYGHGDTLVARIAESFGADALGVALVEEGARLRDAGIKIPVLSFSALDPVCARSVLEHGLTPVVGRFEDLESLLACRPADAVAVHLKFNTGMQRMGFDAGEIDKLRVYLDRHADRLTVTGVCTHLGHGEDILQKDGPSRVQIDRFHVLTAGFPGIRHVHKSASLAKIGPAKCGDFPFGARPGIGMYGLPHEGRDVGPGLEPVLRWRTELVRVHTVEKGEAVSYGGRWTASRRSIIGVVPVGYGDGYMCCLSNKGEMLCRGRRVPVVGRVCMDYIMLDLTELAGQGLPQTGEEVIILGEQGRERISAVDIAEKAGTIVYEVVTAIGARVAREEV
jgi:alanine racemase